jgi:hypothetical protein
MPKCSPVFGKGHAQTKTYDIFTRKHELGCGLPICTFAHSFARIDVQV